MGDLGNGQEARPRPGRRPPRVVAFDTETDRLLNASRSNFKDLRVTVAVAVDAEGAYHTFFGEKERGLDGLGRLFDDADAIVAYNGRGFDLRVLRNHCADVDVDRWAAKLVDPFEAMRSATGSWVKLDELLEANGLPRKSGDGVSAVEWWAAGERARVAEYCKDDVEGLAALLALGRFAFPIKGWAAAANPSPANTGAAAAAEAVAAETSLSPDSNGRTKKARVVLGWAELDWDAYVDVAVASRDDRRSRLRRL